MGVPNSLNLTRFIRDPRNKHPGVFIFNKEKMDKKRMIDIKNDFLLDKYELTQDEVEQLIEEKLLRAREYYEALRAREERVLKEFE